MTRRPRDISEREIAIALVLEFAASGMRTFSLLGFYDDDAYLMSSIAGRLDVADDTPFKNKLVRVVRNLVRHGVLYSQKCSTHKEYLGEPTQQMEYGFVNPGKHRLLTAAKTEYTGGPDWEAEFLLRRAYPSTELT